MHIPFVVYDGYFEESGELANIIIDNFDGGLQAGQYLKKQGHSRVLCISDNDICMDHERFSGLKKVLSEAELKIVPIDKNSRWQFYEENLRKIRGYTAVFAVSDYYAIDLLHFLNKKKIAVPEEMSIIGFDDTVLGRMSLPALTTICQDSMERAKTALWLLKELKEGRESGRTVKLEVYLVERDSVKQLKS